ncbi:MAG: HEAT repeat domain-containing protein [Planctomycetes bacterium]|jgi:hypothetical protein|nr:HEAT repeat domain-containing protein [Planctomycetota bacterium]
MKTKALVLTFAVCAGALAAQQTTPSQELAPIVAVEEQERDLAKAERLYREAIDGGKLSAAAKEMATLRLVELLMKLGKRDEAKVWMGKITDAGGGAVVSLDDVTAASPQDRERQEALRAKARELVQKVLGQQIKAHFAQQGADDTRTGIVDDELRRQVEWLGEAAVPEIGAALAAGKPTFAGKAAGDLSSTNSRTEALRGLAGVLWRLGSPAARAQLEAAYRDGSEAFRVLLATQAARHAPTLRDLVIQWLNEDPSEAVFWQLARSGLEISGTPFTVNQGWVEGRNNWEELPPEVFLVAVQRRSPALRARVLRSLPWGRGNVVPWSSAAASRACAMVRELANGTDPEVVRTALAALANPRLQITPEGFDCLVDHLGRIGDDVPLNYAGVPRELQKEGMENLFAKHVVVRLWPRLVAAARRGVPARSEHWVRQALSACGSSLDGSMLDDLIALQPLGYTGLLAYLSGRIDLPQALRLVQAFAQMDEANFEDGARGLLKNDLPPEALPLLVGKTEMAVRLGKLQWLTTLVARTGNPDAVPWLLAQAERDKDLELSEHLLQLGRRTQAEPVRSALRQYAENEKVASESKSRLYLALLSMHDTATLARIGEGKEMLPAARHAYATAKDAKPISPLGYLLMDQPDPPHGFTEAELIAFVRGAKVFEAGVSFDGIDPERVPTTPLLMALAERSTLHVGSVVTSRSQGIVRSRSSSWQEAMATRIAAEEDLDGPLHRWLRSALASSVPARRVVEYLGKRDLAAIRPQLELMLTGDDADMARFAFDSLRGSKPPLDYEVLTNSKHQTIVWLAADAGMGAGSLSIATVLRLLPSARQPQTTASIGRYLGDKLAVDAVPALLQLVQHQEPEVRQAANEALAKIRFVHEQKSYWDRITKGLDASPSSAVEKLLLQSKPGAPAEQRLLAITSLGALGMPEALPFLIEWTQDADPGIAKAAKDAITQIHLNPRR